MARITDALAAADDAAATEVQLRGRLQSVTLCAVVNAQITDLVIRRARGDTLENADATDSPLSDLCRALGDALTLAADHVAAAGLQLEGETASAHRAVRALGGAVVHVHKIALWYRADAETRARDEQAFTDNWQGLRSKMASTLAASGVTASDYFADEHPLNAIARSLADHGYDRAAELLNEERSAIVPLLQESPLEATPPDDILTGWIVASARSVLFAFIAAGAREPRYAVLCLLAKNLAGVLLSAVGHIAGRGGDSVVLAAAGETFRSLATMAHVVAARHWASISIYHAVEPLVADIDAYLRGTLTDRHDDVFDNQLPLDDDTAAGIAARSLAYAGVSGDTYRDVAVAGAADYLTDADERNVMDALVAHLDLYRAGTNVTLGSRHATPPPDKAAAS